MYFLTGQGIDPDNPANSKFDINRTTGEIFVLKVKKRWFFNYFEDFFIVRFQENQINIMIEILWKSYYFKTWSLNISFCWEL